MTFYYVANRSLYSVTLCLFTGHMCVCASVMFCSVSRDEGVIYVVGHPLLNRRCTRLPGCIRLRNDRCCVGWSIVKLYSLTHSLESAGTSWKSTVGVLYTSCCHSFCSAKTRSFSLLVTYDLLLVFAEWKDHGIGFRCVTIDRCLFVFTYVAKCISHYMHMHDACNLYAWDFMHMYACIITAAAE